MKIFVSSLITGMEPFRAAARGAIIQLGHEPVMAEDLGAQPASPQIACLQGLRQSAAVILILGADYGAKQPSGLSPTHEEYREAKDKRPIIAFVQDEVTRDPDQASFVNEVQAWDSGLFRDGFSSPDQLWAKITRRLHEWEVATMAGPVDEQEMLQRALSLIPEDRRGYSRAVRTLVLAIASSPRQPILRPTEIERDAFHQELLQAALFGPQRLFTTSKPTTAIIEDHALVVTHDEVGRVRLDGEGNVMMQLPLSSVSHDMVVIEENVSSVMTAGLRYAVWLLDRIDQTQRLTHVALAATLSGGDMTVWRTQREQDASPNSYVMGFGRDDHRPVHLTPAHRPRPALNHNADQLVEDLVTLLRREWRSK
jgi:Domain of unknown function (DUF4062)